MRFRKRISWRCWPERRSMCFTTPTDRAKAAYVPSEEHRAFLDQYVASLAAGAQPAEAFVQAKHIRPMQAASKDAAGIQGAVRSTIEAHFDSWKPWKPDRLQDYALGVFSSMAASSARRAGGPAPAAGLG